MINIDFGPSTILGIILLFQSIFLYLVRTLKPKLAKDYDIFFSSLGLLSGGILIFQGWRLDPILLFGQMLSSGTAIFFILESIKLRSLNDNKKEIRQKYLDIKQNIVNSTNDPIQEFNLQTQKKNKRNFSQELKYTDPQEYSKGSELTNNSFFRD
jgi:hypothetical protein